MKVFKKNITTRQGVNSANQAVVSIKVSLYFDGQNPNEVLAQPATVDLADYKDKEAIVNQKEGISIVDGVNGLYGGFGVQQFIFSNSSVELWGGLYWNEFIFYVLAKDIDFTVKKLPSGDALKYDAGLDTFTFGSDVYVDSDIEMNGSNAFYFGDRNTDGTWRIIRSGNNLVFEDVNRGHI